MTRSALRRFLVAVAALAATAAGVVALSPLATAGARPQLSDLRTYATCPKSDRQQLTSAAAGAASRLVPAAPRQVLLCRYSGLNPSPRSAGRLLVQRLVGSRPTVARLTREFLALKPFPSGAFACPADFGVKIIAIFRYLPAPRSDDPVTLDPNGCAAVTNGRLTRTAMLAPGPALIGQLETMTATRR
jgi:hypothetical protein